MLFSSKQVQQNVKVKASAVSSASVISQSHHLASSAMPAVTVHALHLLSSAADQCIYLLPNLLRYNDEVAVSCCVA